MQGEQQAAITLTAIYQRADQINSAGGYLRCLTDRALGTGNSRPGR
ncbi:replication initiation protein RepC [Mesorhizobium huakuii]